jgi:Cd2+/Zn2+-exporting ATPase
LSRLGQDQANSDPQGHKDRGHDHSHRCQGHCHIQEHDESHTHGQEHESGHGLHVHDPGNSCCSHSHAHPHGDGCSCAHSHDITLSGGGHGDSGLKELLPPLIGVIGIGIGFTLQRLGYSTYRIPYFWAAVLAGYPVARAGLKGLFSGGGADINLLTTIAGIGAMILGEWAEGAAVLTLFSIGEYLEVKAGERTRKSIREVMDLSPMMARLKQGDRLKEISAEQVGPGDVVVVFPGEKISVDGQIVSGESAVNEAPITGESVPVDKIPGSSVFAGSLNGEGALEISVTRTAQDTTIARIIAMVEESQSRKAESQRMVDSFAKIWTPLMLGLALAVSIGVPLVFNKSFRPWVYRGLTVLIVSCPCSLVISTPVTVVGAIARAAKKGVLIKGGVHLEELGRVRVLGIDKTGTITEGRVVVDEIVPVEGGLHDEDGLLAFAAAVESRSEHPLAKAIVEEATARGIDFNSGDGFTSIRGKGAYATYAGQKVYVGSRDLFLGIGSGIPGSLMDKASHFKNLGKTVVYIGSETEALGLLVLSDAIRSEAREAISRLREHGIETVMLTGDDVKTANVVASKVGISVVHANLMPEDKLDVIRGLKNRSGSVAMVGDGVNDAPSLAEANVGIAMGKGADVALETADVALMKSDLKAVHWAIGLARQSRRLIIQNVSFSIAVKLLALVMVFGGVLPLWLAVLADSGAAVLVTFNGLRILGYKDI